MSVTTKAVDPVDERLPIGKLFMLGLQHVLVMYAGAVAVPLIIGGALGLPKDQIAFLISADLMCCGIATLLQSVGVGRFGIRMPVIMAVTFVFSCLVIIFNLIADLLYGWLDPRIAYR